MPVEERRRAELFEGLAGAIGPEPTGTLFEMFEDLATRADLDELRREMREGFEQVDAQFDRVDARFDQVDAHFDQVDARLGQVDARFDQVDAHFDQVDARLAQVDARFDQVDARFGQVDARLAQVDARFDQVDARFGQVDDRFDSFREHFDLRLDALRNELVATFEHGLREAVVGQTRIIVFSLMTAFVAVSGLAFGAARVI